jgi:hypothetical protein
MLSLAASTDAEMRTYRRFFILGESSQQESSEQHVHMLVIIPARRGISSHSPTSGHQPYSTCLVLHYVPTVPQFDPVNPARLDNQSTQIVILASPTRKADVAKFSLKTRALPYVVLSMGVGTVPGPPKMVFFDPSGRRRLAVTALLAATIGVTIPLAVLLIVGLLGGHPPQTCAGNCATPTTDSPAAGSPSSDVPAPLPSLPTP